MPGNRHSYRDERWPAALSANPRRRQHLEPARLVPLDDRQTGVAKRGRNPAFGLWRDQTGSVEEQIDSLRKGWAFD